MIANISILLAHCCIYEISFPLTIAVILSGACHCAGIVIFCTGVEIYRYVPDILNATTCSLSVLLKITGWNTTVSPRERRLGRFGLIINGSAVCIVSVAIPTLVSLVFTNDSITRVVRLSGNASAVICTCPLASVVLSAFRYAVSLNTHLFFLLFPHFIDPPSPHLDPSEVSFISSFSTKVLSDSQVLVPRYLFMS